MEDSSTKTTVDIPPSDVPVTENTPLKNGNTLPEKTVESRSSSVSTKSTKEKFNWKQPAVLISGKIFYRVLTAYENVCLDKYDGIFSSRPIFVFV